MKDWIAASNPLAPAGDHAWALRRARLSAVALWLSALSGLVYAALTMVYGDQVYAAMLEAVSAQAETPEQAEIARSFLSPGVVRFAMITAVFIGLAQIVIGLVQWRRPNRIIPLLFLLLGVYGLVSGLVAFMMAGQMGYSPTAGMPAWSQGLSYLIQIVALVFHVGGWRGAQNLHALKMQSQPTI
jgi:hypothetical protein